MLCPEKTKSSRKHKRKENTRHNVKSDDSTGGRTSTLNVLDNDVDIVVEDEKCEVSVVDNAEETFVDDGRPDNGHGRERTSLMYKEEIRDPMDEDVVTDDVIDVSSMLDNLNVNSVNVSSKDFQKEDKYENEYSDKSECVDNRIVDYKRLLEEIKVDEENFEPSAPLPVSANAVKTEENEACTFAVPKINCNLKENVNTKKKIVIDFKIEIDKEVLSPLSDEELSQYYHNSKLNEAQTFIEEFVSQEVNNEAKVIHPFYELLANYLKVKNNLNTSRENVQALEKKLDGFISELWTVWKDIEVTETGKCKDGNSICARKSYTLAKFNEDKYEEFKSTLQEIKASLFEAFKVDSFNCLKYKLKIDLYIQSLMRSCREFMHLTDSSTISLSLASSDSYFKECLSNIRTAIGILFIFLRRQKVDMSTSFIEEARQWLTDLVAILIRTGNWKDHLFILSHILRCPGGVAKWASSYIQFPKLSTLGEPFSDPSIKHMMTVMSILLQPIEKREEFMNEWKTKSSNDDSCWVVVDSDDEDDDLLFSSSPLKENDLVLLLNQIPLKDLFAAVLGLKDGVLKPEDVTAHHLMQLFSFSLDFIKILHTGLQVYSMERYKQFAKRLGRLIRDIILYTTDELDQFRLNQPNSDILKRLQVEYDNFFIKSANSIYSSKKYGTWQFLAVIPYHRTSKNVIVQLYSMLQLDSGNGFEINLGDFEDSFQQLSESEQFYLLSTYTSMALARDLSELDFINAVVHQLLYVGFIGSHTSDKCYKNVISLLYNLCVKHSFLMSYILRIQSDLFAEDASCDQSLSIYLWKQLPVKIWKLDSEDVQILSSWLFCPVQSVRNELAKIVLKSLNYDFVDGCLFLPVETHRIIAHAIMKANAKLSRVQEVNVIKNVSSLMGLQEPEQTFQLWSWSVLLKLHLHLLDQAASSVRNSLQNLNYSLQNIPELDSVEELKDLVEQKDPIACYIALMTTLVGHSVPLISINGFALVEELIKARRCEIAIVCLQYITLMFIDCPDSLCKCQQFISVLTQLINADYSYLKLAKNLKACPTPVLSSLENMIDSQISYCEEIFLPRVALIQLWVKSLTKIPLWSQEAGVIQLLDSLCKAAYFDKMASAMVKEMFATLLPETLSPTESTSSLASFVKWMNKPTIPTLLIRGCNGNAVWFFLKVIEVEQELNEYYNQLWPELLKELFVTNEKKTNVNNCLKKACTNLQIPVRTAEILTIYKLCYQILETKINHPLILVLWQKFLLLYFQRVPGLVDNGCVGDKFFHGIINQNLFKRLRQRLRESCEYFVDAQTQCSEPERDGHYSQCARLFRLFELWLDEPKLLQPNLSLHLLPPQFETELLGTIIHQVNSSSWINCVDYVQVQNEFKKSVRFWEEFRNRGFERSKITSSESFDRNKSFCDKILDRLNSYDAPLQAPKINTQNYSFTNMNCVLMDANTIGSYLRNSFKNILDYTEFYTQEIGKYGALCCDMQELVQCLYTVKKSSVVLRQKCDGYEKVINGKRIYFQCSGPAVITLAFEESEVDKKNQDLFDQCLRNFNRSLQNSLTPVQHVLGLSVVTVEKTIEDLRTEYNILKNGRGDGQLIPNLLEAGTRLFYDFTQCWSEAVSATPSVEKVFEECVAVLGKTFVSDNPAECESLLAVICEQPKFTRKLGSYFNPNACATPQFVDLYANVRKVVPEIRLYLLSRFNLKKWLVEKKPRFAERSSLISEIFSGLKSHGCRPDNHFDLIELFNSHLRELLMFDFPEHYGEILKLLLEGSEAQTVPVSTWFMFINAIAPEGLVQFVEGKLNGNNFEPGQNAKKLKSSFTHFATLQKTLSLAEVRETILHLANAFRTDRLKYGLYGLYPKYRDYVEPILIFCGMLSHSYVAETLKLDLGSLSVRIADQLWPLLRDLYAPWLVPYWSKQEKSQSAKWIQELTDDRCVLLPWVGADVSLASYSCAIFIDSIRFVLDTLPGTNNILNHVWFFYVTNYAHIQVKDYVLRVVHKNMLQLPWCNFHPNLQDIELMVRVVEHFIPMAHSLLSNIFVEVNWMSVVQCYSNQCDVETLAKLHVYMLHLLVKLPCEPSLKQNNQVLVLLEQAKDYSWHLVDSANYDFVLNWFVMSCDPRIVLMDENLEYYRVDSLILQILRICAGYSATGKEFHPTTVTKRLMYIRANNKWLTTANSRFKCKDSALFKSAAIRILDEIESTGNVSISGTGQSDEITLLMSEFLNLFKEEELTSILEEIFNVWLSTKKDNFLIYGLLRSIALSSVAASTFGSIAEACIECYFQSNGDSDWSAINAKFIMYASGQSGLQKVLLNNGNLLALHAMLMKCCGEDSTLVDKKIVVNDIFHWFETAKKSDTTEPKIALMIIYACKIADSVISVDEAEAVSVLSRLANLLIGFVNDKGNGILSAIGFKRSERFTTRLKFICLVTCGGIVRLFKSFSGDYSDKIDKIVKCVEQANASKQYQCVGILPADEISKINSTKDLINILKHLGYLVFSKNYLK